MSDKITRPIVTVRRSIVQLSNLFQYDLDISLQTILNGVSGQLPAEYTALAVCVEGARPLSTWDCIPFVFYLDSKSCWSVHNLGTAADNVEVTFTVFYTNNVGS